MRLGILPDREVPGILWVGLGLLTAELAILWGKTWWESRGRGQAIPAGAHWWQAEKEELAAAAVMLAVWWGFLALCAAGGCSPYMEPDRYELAPGGSGDHPLRGGAAALAEREAGPVAGGACHRRAPAVRRPGLFSG